MGDIFQSIFGWGGGDVTVAPEPPPPPPIPEEPDPEEQTDDERLAEQRASLDARRRGTRSLRIENPGVSTGVGAGLRL